MVRVTKIQSGILTSKPVSKFLVDSWHPILVVMSATLTLFCSDGLTEEGPSKSLVEVSTPSAGKLVFSLSHRWLGYWVVS